MKVKKLLTSLLVSILVITSLPTGVFAYTIPGTTVRVIGNTGQAKGEGFVKVASSNEIISGYLAQKPSWHTTEFTAIYTAEQYTKEVAYFEDKTNTTPDGSLLAKIPDLRIMTIVNPTGKAEDLQIKYIGDISFNPPGYDVSEVIEPAKNMFWFAKYPDTFPIKEFATVTSYADTTPELYVRYINSAITNIGPEARSVLANANAIYSEQLTYNYKNAASQKAITDYAGKTYWCFNAEGNIIYGTTANGLVLDGYTEITKDAYFVETKQPTAQEYLKDEKIDIEESKAWTDENFVFVINQTKLAPRNQSCWTCAQEAIVMNSNCLKGTGYQMTGVVTESNHAGWSKWSDAMGVSATATGPVSFNAVTNSNALCKVNGSWTAGSSGDLEVEGGASSNTAYIVGWQNNGTTEYFKDMSFDRLQTVFKSFYNSGYWLTIGIRDNVEPSGAAKPNGKDDEFTSNHTIMFAGIDNNHIMVLDSARVKSDTTGNKVEDYIHELTEEYSSYKKGDGKHNVVYVMAYKFSDEDCSLKNICGGADVYMTEADQYNLQNMGINNKKGYFTEDQLSSKVVLSEADLAGVLSGATLDNLDHNDLESLDTWKDLVEEENMAVKVIRIIIQLIGVLMLLWSILLFAGYHFDRINNLVDISVVHILTLGRLRPITYDGEEATFGKDKSEKKDKISTVNSRNITTICVVTALFAVLILTGTIYNLLASLVNLINSILRR